ncbi:uncharacterized membrane protein YddG-like [Paramacrobiotus metropolitanus]|uniref:uncharacterized membrane protein YddG-like n=1 Tax=Paramacrobiotus metropolitanus TaxID=2943436 RepID=UPI0024464A26|nr:uncharacterized membrane protein YddG-like [Paramacrobiotus metropolitanus]
MAVAGLEALLTSTRTELAKAKDDLATARTTIDDTDCEADRLQRENERLTEDLANLQDEINRLRNGYNLLYESHQNLMKAIQQGGLSSQAVQQKEAQNGQQDRIIVLEANNAGLVKDYQAATQRITEMNEELERLSTENACLDAEKSHLADINSELSAEPPSYHTFPDSGTQRRQEKVDEALRQGQRFYREPVYHQQNYHVNMAVEGPSVGDPPKGQTIPAPPSPVDRGTSTATTETSVPRKAKPDFETPALTKLQNQPLAAIDPALTPAEPEKGTSVTDKPKATEEPKVAPAPKEKPNRPKTPKKPKATLTAQQVLEEDEVAEDEADKDLLTRITTGREKSEKVSKDKKQKSNTVLPDVSDKSSTVPPDVLDKAVDKAGQNDV